MSSNDFCLWLKGYFDLWDRSKPLSRAQTDIIEHRLSSVFTTEDGKHKEPVCDPAYEGWWFDNIGH